MNGLINIENNSYLALNILVLFTPKKKKNTGLIFPLNEINE